MTAISQHTRHASVAENNETSKADAATVPSALLVVEDSPERREELRTLLEFVDHGTVRVTDFAHWRDVLEEGIEDVLAVVAGSADSDQMLDVMLRGVRDLDLDVPVLLVVGAGEPPSISNDVAAHVLCRVELPTRYETLIDALNKARTFRETRRQNRGERNVELFRSLVGTSRGVQRVRKLMTQVAGSDANVLILGESGTGKEVVARNLHYHSKRRENPFVPINCGAIPPDLLESELFGHEKGSFTGAITARMGRFEMAEGGTLFLDEIGDMPLNMQVKLLRVLQERVFERVGSSKSIKADVRIIAATHRDLEILIKDGKFREDLYYRLNVFPIEMPPLRQRINDIPLLINELITRFEHERRGSVRLTPAAVLSLCQYPWPGNVRELANLVERLVILYPYGVVDVQDLPEKFRIPGVVAAPAADMDETPLLPDTMLGPRLPKEGLDLKEFLANLECSYIKQALDESKGIVAHAAKLLKMRRTTLVEKMRKYGLHRGEDAPNF